MRPLLLPSLFPCGVPSSSPLQPRPCPWGSVFRPTSWPERGKHIISIGAGCGPTCPARDLLAPLTVRCLFFSVTASPWASCQQSASRLWDLQACWSQVLGVSFSCSVLCLFLCVFVSFWGVLGSALSFPSGSGLFPVLFPSPSSFLLGLVLELQ